MNDALFQVHIILVFEMQDALDEFLDDEAKEKKDGYELSLIHI